MYNVKTENHGNFTIDSDLELCIMLDINDNIVAEIKDEIKSDGESLLIHREYDECWIEATQ